MQRDGVGVGVSAVVAVAVGIGVGVLSIGVTVDTDVGVGIGVSAVVAVGTGVVLGVGVGGISVKSSNFTTKASWDPFKVSWYTPVVIGKSDDPLNPTTKTLLFESRAMPLPSSSSFPPRNVDARRLVRLLLNLETNASVPPPLYTPAVVGRSNEPVPLL